MPAIGHHKITVGGLSVFAREAGPPARPSIAQLPGDHRHRTFTRS